MNHSLSFQNTQTSSIYRVLIIIGCLILAMLSGCTGTGVKPTTGSRTVTRSLMVSDVYEGYWATGVVTDEDERRKLLAFCQAPHGDSANPITRLYFSAGCHGFDQISADDEKLRDLVRDVHAVGMEIYILQGDPHWATPSGDNVAYRVIERLLVFNRQSELAERFDGIVLDIEPFLLSAAKKDELDWQEDQPEIWRIYLNVLDGIGQQVRDHNNSTDTPLVLTECIPPWYEPRQNNGRANFEDVMDRVDFVWVMNYYDKLDVLYRMGDDEIRYADQIGKPIVIGLNVIPIEPSLDVGLGNTFWDNGHTELETIIDSFLAKYYTSSSLGEISIFSYANYRKLKR